MDICIVNDSFNLGGVERVAIELANSLQKNGHRLSLIDFSGNNYFYYEVNKAVKIAPAIKTRSLNRKLIGTLFKIKYYTNKKPINIYNIYKEQTKDLIAYLKKSNHEILIMCQGILTALIPVIKNEIPNLKIIAWQHNEFDIYIKKYYTKFLNDYFLGLKQADLVICLTEIDQGKFSSINNNTINIYNPLTITANMNINNLQNKNIIFVGRLDLKQKGLDYLVSIGENLCRGWKILVAGDGPDKNSFLKMIKKNKLDEKIILKGSLTSAELVNLYSSGSIFISTSRWEGFGLSITEAMAFGLPIISFNNQGPSEILKNGEYGILIEKNDINEFLRNIKELMEDHNKRLFFQKQSLTRVKDFKKEVILKEWESNLLDL